MDIHLALKNAWQSSKIGNRGVCGGIIRGKENLRLLELLSKQPAAYLRIVVFRCKLLNGTTVAEGDFVRFEQDSMPRSADVVFIVEAKQCNRDLRARKNIDTIVEMIEKELIVMNVTHNR